MMIQTLVENAIKHGLEPKPEGGRLSVSAEIVHGKLAVTVADTGVGFDAAQKARIFTRFQQADGSIRIPAALRPYLGALEVLRA